MSEVKATLRNLYDADTLKVETELGNTVVVRLANVDADESSTESGKRQTEFVMEWVMWEKNHIDGKYELVLKSEGQWFSEGGYGRILGRIVGVASDDDLGSSLMANFEDVGWWYDREKDFKNGAKK